MKLQHVSSSADTPAKSEPHTDSELPAEEPSLLADLAVLADEIERAAAGSAALDARIHFGFRVATRRSPDIIGLLIEQGITWPTVEAVLDEQIPPFTTSLDAALDGENITFVLHAAKRGRWGAMQKALIGEEVLVWAATEALARRLAAIRTWMVDLEASAAASTAPAAAPSAPAEQVAPASSEKDWEVLF